MKHYALRGSRSALLQSGASGARALTVFLFLGRLAVALVRRALAVALAFAFALACQRIRMRSNENRSNRDTCTFGLGFRSAVRFATAASAAATAAATAAAATAAATTAAAAARTSSSAGARAGQREGRLDGRSLLELLQVQVRVHAPDLGHRQVVDVAIALVAPEAQIAARAMQMSSTGKTG